MTEETIVHSISPIVKMQHVMDVTHHCCQDLNVWIHAATVCIRILCSSARHRRCCCCCEEGWVKFPMSTKDVRTLLHELKHKLTSGWWWKMISKGYLSEQTNNLLFILKMYLMGGLVMWDICSHLIKHMWKSDRGLHWTPKSQYNHVPKKGLLNCL